MLHLLGLLAAFVLGCIAGYYLHYRYGSDLKSGLQAIETRVQDISKVVKK